MKFGILVVVIIFWRCEIIFIDFKFLIKIFVVINNVIIFIVLFIFLKNDFVLFSIWCGFLFLIILVMIVIKKDISVINLIDIEILVVFGIKL